MSLYADPIINALSGRGSDADFVNLFGDNYAYNQTAFDAADNGTVSKGAGTATVNSPSWMQSLTSIFGTAANVTGTVLELTGNTTKPATAVAKPSAAAPATSQTASRGKSWWVALLGIGAAIILGVWYFGRRK